MPDQLSHGIRQDVECWCRRIVDGCDDDSEVFEELYAHVEDSMLSYMNGETALTEEDAFMLVREHFGNPVRVRTHLLEAHPGNNSAFPWGRFFRISAAAACAASIVALPVMFAVLVMIQWMFEAWGPMLILGSVRQHPIINMSLLYALMAGLLSVSPFIYILQSRLRVRAGHLAISGALLRTTMLGSVVYIATVAVFALLVFPGLSILIWRNFYDVPSSISVFYNIENFSVFLNQSLATGLFAVMPWILRRYRQAGFLDLDTPVITRSRLVVSAAVLGAILTPPDPISMVLFTFIMIITFEVTRAMSGIRNRQTVESIR